MPGAGKSTEAVRELVAALTEWREDNLEAMEATMNWDGSFVEWSECSAVDCGGGHMVAWLHQKKKMSYAP